MGTVDKGVQGLAILAEAVITAYLVNEERNVVIGSVRAWEVQGKTAEEISELLKTGRLLAEHQAQAAIDAARRENDDDE